MAKDFVCVVLVNYNGVEDTIECVRSLSNCSHKNLKIIIVDNCSTHGRVTYNDVICHDRCEIIYNDVNSGFSGANNIGIQRGIELGADYFLILNNDTTVNTDFLSFLLDDLHRNSSIGIATGKIFYYDDPKYLWFGGSFYDNKLLECKIDGIGKLDSVAYSRPKIIPFATACFWLIPKHVIQIVGPMSEDYFLYYEDADYCERVKKAGFEIFYEPKSCIYHKESRSTKKGSDSYNYYTLRNYLIFIKKFNSLSSRLVPIFSRLVLSAKDVIRGRRALMPELKAWFDYFRGRKGKMK